MGYTWEFYVYLGDYLTYASSADAHDTLGILSRYLPRKFTFLKEFVNRQSDRDSTCSPLDPHSDVATKRIDQGPGTNIPCLTLHPALAMCSYSEYGVP
jgi:hypothetical protein